MAGKLSRGEIALSRRLVLLHKRMCRAALTDPAELARLKKEFEAVLPTASRAVLEIFGKYLDVRLRRCLRQKPGK